MNPAELDSIFMAQALAQAKQAAVAEEVPVGAVLVYQNEVIAEGHNQPITLSDPTAHAEIMTLRQAGQVLHNYRLLETTLYVTLEPCMMCMGALLHARVRRVVYGACDPKAGAVVSQLQLPEAPFLNHRIACEGGVLAGACAAILKSFFQNKR